MDYEKFRGIYKYIAIHINIDTAKQLHELLGGHDVTFPKKLYTKEYIHSTIKSEFNGSNVPELAKRFDMSERRVRQILNSD